MNRPFIPVLPCMCANLRRAARALTQHYDEALRLEPKYVHAYTARGNAWAVKKDDARALKEKRVVNFPE